MKNLTQKFTKGLTKTLRISVSLVILILVLISTVLVYADDGPIFRKNVSKTPELETENANIRMLPLYVPPQSSDGTLLESIEYENADGVVEETYYYVRPLIAHYIDGHVEELEDAGGFPGHGERDAFGAVSLDDGATWKRTNLSMSADRSSFKIKDGKMWIEYPGDVGRSAAASDGNQVLITWVSRYCGQGNPGYAMTDEERGLLADYLVGTGTVADAAACTDDDPTTVCTYLEDSFAVSGSQGSSDLTDEGFPQIGELPYACLWAARGVMMPPAAEGEESTFTWFKAERLTSGVRDANRPEAACVKGAGCVITWQEDPEGIRPGEGEGPGEGWSGAIAHHQTDTWYTYIDWADFGLVSEEGIYGDLYADSGDLLTWIAENSSGSPKAAVPMSVPMRLTDNAMCTADDEESKPYCFIDYDNSGTADFCASTVSVSIDTPVGSTDVEMCVSEDGRLMRGNTAATRARLGLHGYSSLGEYDPLNPDAYPIDRAWFYMAYEENKGLGEDGEEAVVPEDPALKVDMGKNVWYHTFDMFTPELVSQGLMLNQPAVYPDDWSDPSGLLIQDASLGPNFYQIDPDPIYETQAAIETTLYQTEISRRPSPISQDWYDAGTTGTVAFQLWKQGIIRRGGPADIMARRFVIPDEFDPAVDNPYDYENMACENWAFTDGSNPRYVKGLCAEPANNLSGNTILEGDCGDAAACLEAFPFNEYYDDYQGGEGGEEAEGISKIWTWQQYGADYGAEIIPEDNNLDDVSWQNPYDVAKGHRGFMTGDMIMAIYAWSPNWLANSVGHDNYNLYTRRSFDGGQTWSTLPASFTHNDVTYNGSGTTTCEWMGPVGSETEYSVCTTYTAGEFEQARNLSQLIGTHETILDPRYSPTTRSITEASVSTASLPAGFTAPLYVDDTRDPSRHFIVYETGDNTTVAEGEAEPLDLFYSRAVDWGDHFLVWQDETDMAACLPAAEDENLAGFCNEFDALEGKSLWESGEASITASPGGMFYYAIWNQVNFTKSGDFAGSDAWFRRVLFLDEYVPQDSDDGSGSIIDPPDEPGFSIFLPSFLH